MRYHHVVQRENGVPMTRETFRVITDSDVPSAVLDLIRTADKHIVLVSPYNSFWGHLKDELRLAIRQREVRVVAFYNPREHTRGDGMDWLYSEGAEVYRVNYLHAKLYLNESSAILTSMNLIEGSSRNSMDIGMVINGRGETYNTLLEYTTRLSKLGERIDSTSANEAPGEKPRPQRPPRARSSSMVEALIRSREEIPKTALKTAKAWLTRGRCIRCQKIIPFATDNPLCESHYEVWVRYKNKDYQEKFCHKCGRQSATTFAKPLCLSCYSNSRSRLPFRMEITGGDTGKQPEDAAPATGRKP
jgi:hypothetical protein